MTIKEQIIADKINALKNGNKELNILLGTLLGEFDRKGKNLSDSEAITEIRKMAVNCRICKNINDAEILEMYLPQAFTEEATQILIANFCLTNNIKEKKQLGEVMKFLKEKYNNVIDMKIASQYAAKILS